MPLEVVAIDQERCLALCEDDTGARETVEVALVWPVAPGDHVLVHAGAGLVRL